MSRKERKLLYRILIAAALFAAAMLIPAKGYYRLLLYLSAYLLAGGDVLLKAGRNILRGQVFDENFLMALATVGAFALGEYPEGVMVMVLYQVGELFQSYAVGKSRRSISDLMDIRPDYANIYRDGELVRVDPYEVRVGDEIVVKAGEKIPLDGVVLDGSSTVDTSALTGESVPRSLAAGGEALSGCINLSGLLTIQVTKGFEDSTVSKILELVEHASSKKARTENFITKFARYYTPAVVIGAVVLAVLPPLLSPEATFAEWVQRALTFLVISCPCALVISVPLGFFGGIGGASKCGILVKGSNYLEALANVETIVFDKTGTLTKGDFRVTQIEPANAEPTLRQLTQRELLEVAALAEGYSSHPIATSILAAYGEKPAADRVGDVREIAGRGIQAQVDGRQVLAGNAAMMAEAGIGVQEAPAIGTPVYLASEGQYLGYILIADEIKPDAVAAIATLKRENHIRKTVMLTGDRLPVAQAVGSVLGVDEVYANLLPGDKVQKVEGLLEAKQRGKGTLAFVGDGINDAPVLARADIGIAMGGLGSDAAIEAADVVIMDDRPSKISTAIGISKKTLRIVKQNIVFALGVKAVALVLGALGIATMWAAVFADVGVSVLAIANSMRALRVSDTRQTGAQAPISRGPGVAHVEKAA